MTRKKEKFSLKRFRGAFPYIAVSITTIALAFLGSLDKVNSKKSVSLDSFATEGYNVSTDQLSELYVVAGLSDALGLASASDVAANYVIATTMHEAGQASLGKLEKPPLTNLTVSRGVVEHTVAEGETMDTIAAKYGVSTDQIRWSNGLKTTAVSAGTVLYIPSKAGIVYTVKSGETVEGIAEKYGSSAEEIIALNDLEVSGVSEGMRILIKDGNLPEKERPEYVAPVVRTYTHTYTYLGDTSARTGAVCNRALGHGQCVSWAQIKRPDLGIMANANRWDDIARSRGVLVDRVPAAGTIFQTDSGWYGHVGYVESVNADGSINVSERNYRGCYGVLYSTIPASEVGKFNYIH